MQKHPCNTETFDQEATPLSQENGIRDRHPVRSGTALAHDGTQLQFEVVGDTGPYILFTHATAELGDRNAQRPYISLLGQDYRLIFIQYPGEPKLYTLTPATVARDYLAIVDAAGADRFYYYGYSFGCVTGLQLALRTDRIVALACGGFPVLDGPYKEMLTLSRALIAGPVLIGDSPVPHLPDVGRQFATYYEALQTFDDVKAHDRLTVARMILVGAEDVIMVNGSLLSEYGPKILRQKAQLESLGWDVVIFPGKNHATALAPDLVAPVIKSFFDRYK